MTLESNKTIGGVGAILLLIGTLPYVSSISFGVLALVGIILILVALNGLANIYKDRGIFNNSLYGVIAGIVGAIIAVVVAFVVVIGSLTSFLEKIYPSWNGSLSSIGSLSGMTPNTTNIDVSSILPFVEGIIAIIVVLWVFLIVWMIFARRSLKTLATKSNVGLFGTASLLLIIGAALTIILIGFILLWIGVLLMAIAFFQLKPQAEMPPMMTSTPVQQPPTQM